MLESLALLEKLPSIPLVPDSYGLGTKEPVACSPGSNGHHRRPVTADALAPIVTASGVWESGGDI